MRNLHEVDSASLRQQLYNHPVHKLTARQLNVLALMCEGLPNKVIGRKLNIANGTVKIHVTNIFRALNVSSRVQAVIVARGLGIERESGAMKAPRPAAVVVPLPGVLRLVHDEDAARTPAAPDWSLEAAVG